MKCRLDYSGDNKSIKGWGEYRGCLSHCLLDMLFTFNQTVCYHEICSMQNKLNWDTHIASFPDLLIYLLCRVLWVRTGRKAYCILHNATSWTSWYFFGKHLAFDLQLTCPNLGMCRVRLLIWHISVWMFCDIFCSIFTNRYSVICIKPLQLDTSWMNCNILLNIWKSRLWREWVTVVGKP